MPTLRVGVSTLNHLLALPKLPELAPKVLHEFRLRVQSDNTEDIRIVENLFEFIHSQLIHNTTEKITSDKFRDARRAMLSVTFKTMNVNYKECFQQLVDVSAVFVLQLGLINLLFYSASEEGINIEPTLPEKFIEWSHTEEYSRYCEKKETFIGPVYAISDDDAILDRTSEYIRNHPEHLVRLFESIMKNSIPNDCEFSIKYREIYERVCGGGKESKILSEQIARMVLANDYGVSILKGE